MYKQKREGDTCLLPCVSVWASSVEKFDETCIYISCGRVLVLVCKDCCSLVDNSRLIDNGRKLGDNVKDKYLLTSER